MNVPNSYSAGDEGKVVSNGALVAQTAHAEVTENGTIDTTLNNSVTINVSGGGGGGSVAANAVNFYDYDGSIVAAYTAADFANLTALPANPDRSSEGLTAQGWNWSLADAKTYVASYGKLNVGQMYITTDGKTHIHIHLEQGRTSPMLGVCPKGTVDVDWGDGTTHDTLTGTDIVTAQWTPTHNYAAPGDYVIKLTVSEGGSMGFYGNSSSNQYSGLLRYTLSGDSRNYVYQNAIQKVEIGSGVPSIRNYAFYNCPSLASITIPDSVTSFGSNVFQNCYSLASITIPDSVTSISGNMFYYCYSLASITIPDSVTKISSQMFDSCSSLASITIPDSVTSIESSAFYNCPSLASITIPDSVTSIGGHVFNSCYGVAEYHLAPTTPPTLSGSTAFTGIPTDCIIYVPYSADHSILQAYKTASNWSTYASKMQEEPQ